MVLSTLVHMEALICFKENVIKSLYNNGHKITSSIFQIINDKSKTYFATSDGLMIKEGNQINFIDEKDGLALNELWSMNIDSNGTLYLGTDGNGVDVYSPEKIENFYKTNGLPDNNIWSVYEDDKQNLYIGTDNGLLIKSANSTRLLNKLTGLTGNYIRTVFQSEDGKIYIGTRSGLNVLQANGKIKNYTMSDGLIDNQIFCIAESPQNEILLGTREGVSVLNNGTIENITTDEGLIGNYVQTIVVGKDSTIYFGTYGSGLSYYKNGIYKNITKEDGLTDDKIQTLALGKDGTLYIGTYEGGLNILKNGKIRRIGMEDGLSSNSIQSIIVKDNRLYAATLKSFDVIDLSNEKPIIRIINSDDGLASNDCNREACFMDSKGIVWIGTKNGLTKYNPKNDKINRHPPKVYITGFEIYNKAEDLKIFLKNPDLNYDQNYIKFIYKGIDLSAPEKLIYKYKLSDIDKDWIRTKENSVQYTSLDNGNYTFEIKACNEWGYWSKPIQLSFTINPVWWKRWWSISLFGFLFACGLFLTYKKRIKNLEKENKAQEEFSKRLIQSQEEERKRIAVGLHDSLGQNLLIIKNRALLGIKNKKEEFLKEQLLEISSTASTTLDEVRQIAYDLHPYQLSRLGLTRAIRSIITNVKDSTKINFIDDLANIDNLFSQEAEINIYRIVQENINNIIKHSEAKNAAIKILKKESSISIYIEDDGKGFDKENVYDERKKMKGFGLENIKKRITLLNGEFSINSANGTKIKIIIPF